MPTQILTVPVAARRPRAAKPASPVLLGFALVAIWLLALALAVRFPDAFGQLPDIAGP